MAQSADSRNFNKASFIGLGVMGYPMAGHLVRNGFEVTVYNRTESKAQQWVEEYGGKSAPTPALAAAGAQIVFSCVGNDDDVRAISAGPDGAFSAMASDAIFVDHTTASAEVARELAVKCADKGIAFLDAPVSGGQAGAENGVLTVMVGGSQEAFDSAKPVMDSYARAVGLMGPVGSGQLTKMVNQICIAGLVQGLSEGLDFASRCGLDVDQVLEVISKGAAQSWQMENRGQTMNRNEFEFGFAVDWMRKDLGLCLEEARRVKGRLPVTALVDQFYAEVQAMGGGRWDTSSLIRRLRDT
ncbi:MAG: NAD(P)-dependent oxidoreductase [Proteobacteria bacterium]|jgi:3-hydroxyisobutyrate dehydrogenase|nr:NAD(P)-dependent oxidoreductase [Pseudomonadota bacterium]MBT6348547.1 NAD(P)-dependent oxidoreductase [Pseudomonadota bacterium]MCH1521941.1 NAD(P)-dependent oxidoreductase [Arenicellales bacterium]|tara:strand:- start:390 stop:1286 length:897 start_codon:yes stop_codon:yes gene_type:complete